MLNKLVLKGLKYKEKITRADILNKKLIPERNELSLFG